MKLAVSLSIAVGVNSYYRLVSYYQNKDKDINYIESFFHTKHM